NVLSVVIKDNGKGFDEGKLNRFGNGLNNMRNRMKNINGSCRIENHNGTRVTLSLPV
ncbi:MAG: sensor histidine kinase, partial [Chlorobi bacterium]|nr:sensor histidine kinase [Chlorobiota bacterium]